MLVAEGGEALAGVPRRAMSSRVPTMSGICALAWRRSELVDVDRFERGDRPVAQAAAPGGVGDTSEVVSDGIIRYWGLANDVMR